MKPDKIKIEDLEVFANHGVFPEENVLGQKFVVSAVMYTDTRRACGILLPMRLWPAVQPAKAFL